MSRADVLTDQQIMRVMDDADKAIRKLGPFETPLDRDFAYVRALLAASPVDQPAAVPLDMLDSYAPPLTVDQRTAIEFALGACAGHLAGEPHVAALESLLVAHPGHPQSGPTTAARDVLAERHRQIEQEGRTPSNDDQYNDGELSDAAAAYALAASGWDLDTAAYYWPNSWAGRWFKPTTARRNLVKAGALILAAIERIDRDPGDESHHDHLNGGSL
ncbi:hypothetical protein WL80_07480 [Burkholderia ubonensis]|nr:hypothetical protein WL80_07480 [Burkholderia ubonensis]